MMSGGMVSRPCFSKPASWVVARRIRNRECPSSFEETFVAIGRLACEEHYCVGDNTVSRWLDECGKDRLIRIRAEHVLSRDTEARVTRIAAGCIRVEADSSVPAQIVVEAARFICEARGWRPVRLRHSHERAWVYPGRVAAVIAMAVQHGFDPATLTPATVAKVGSAR